MFITWTVELNKERKKERSKSSFRDTVSPAQLRIDKVEKGDEGSYMCRVDFRNSPTVTSSMVLEVVEQASKPVVITDEGVEVMGSVGPYLLGKALILVCMAEGEPPPRVVWLRDGVVWDEEVGLLYDRNIRLYILSSDGPWRPSRSSEEEHAGDISAREDPCREHHEVRGREQQC